MIRGESERFFTVQKSMRDLKGKLEETIRTQVPRGHPASVDFKVLAEGNFKPVDLLVVIVDGTFDLGFEVV